MPEPTNPPSSPDSTPVSGRDTKATRRRFLQGGLAAAPVLMTLVSRPVLAQQCTTPSGYVSLNASTAGRGVACTGLTPDQWNSTNANSWPSLPTTPFNSVFANDASHYPNKTFQDVLGLSGGGIDEVARYIVAALLNVQAGRVPVLTTMVVKDMWSEYLATQSFSPQAGATWRQDELIGYLRLTSP